MLNPYGAIKFKIEVEGICATDYPEAVTESFGTELKDFQSKEVAFETLDNWIAWLKEHVGFNPDNVPLHESSSSDESEKL